MEGLVLDQANSPRLGEESNYGHVPGRVDADAHLAALDGDDGDDDVVGGRSIRYSGAPRQALSHHLIHLCVPYDEHAHRRIADLEYRLSKLWHLTSLEFAPPLHAEMIHGVGGTVLLDEKLLSVSSLNGLTNADQTFVDVDDTNVTLAITSNASTGEHTFTLGWTGTLATARIADDAVTFAKMQNIATNRLIGRDTAGSGDPEELTVGGGIEFTGSTGIQTSDFTGDVTKAAGGTAQTIANDAVTYAKMQNVSAESRLLGRGQGGGAGDVQEISLGTGMTLTGTTLSSSGGDVVGPLLATDNAIVRFDGTTGKLIQNSSGILDDNGNVVFGDNSTAVYLRLKDTVGNYVGFQSPSTVQESITYTLPRADGENLDCLFTDGAATMAWGIGGASGICEGRLTLTSGTAVTTSDVTGATAVYFTPYVGERICLYIADDFAANRLAYYAFPEFAGALGTLTADLPYDVFCFHDELTPSSTDTLTEQVTFAAAHGLKTGAHAKVRTTGGGLTAGTNYWVNAVSTTELTFHTTVADALAGTNDVNLTASITSVIDFLSLEFVAWTNDTTRATALVRQNGFWCKTGALTRRYLGTFRTTATTTTEDSAAKRFLFNSHNRVRKDLHAVDNSTATWPYGTATWREWNAASAYGTSRVGVMQGLAEELFYLYCLNMSGDYGIACGIGIDTNTANSAGSNSGLSAFHDKVSGTAESRIIPSMTALCVVPTLGFHFYAAVENAGAGISATMYNFASGGRQCGMDGYFMC